MKETYFDYNFSGELANDRGWWFHNMPLPNGTRINGANPNKNREQQLWETFRRVGINVEGKKVLDIGANDGYFTIAALLAGAASVTAINPEEMCVGHFPERLLKAAAEWKVEPEIIVDDFMKLGRQKEYDIIMYFGVFYHAEDPLGHFLKFAELLAPGGKVLVETPLTNINVDKPILEVASDLPERATTIARGQQYVKHLGVGTFFIPNFMALQELAWTCELDIEHLPSNNLYTADLPNRELLIVHDRRTS